VAPCATDTVVIVKAGSPGVALDEVSTHDVEVEGALTTPVGGQLAPSADFTVEEELGVDGFAPLDEDSVGAAKSLEANESDERGIELGGE